MVCLRVASLLVLASGFSGRAAAQETIDYANAFSKAFTGDIWADLPALKVAKQLLDGDHNPVLVALLGNKDIEKLFGSPDDLELFLKVNPTLLSIKGVSEIVSSGRRLTPADGANALKAMKDFMSAGMASLKTISSPSGFASKFQEYASGSDAQIKALMSRANMGDSNARQQLQRAILDKELGSAVDFDKLGWNGVVPEFLQAQLKVVQDEAGDLYSLFHQNDPLVKMIMENPSFAKLKPDDMLSFVNAGVQQQLRR